MANLQSPSAVPMLRNQYMELSHKSKRIPSWAPFACFALAFTGLFIPGIAAGVILLLLRKRDKDKLDSFFRENIVPMCLAQVFGTYEYSLVGSITEQEVRASGIVPAQFGSFHGDTYISAVYRGLPLAMSNLKLDKNSDSNGKETLFKGPFAVFAAPAPLGGNLWVFENESNYSPKTPSGRILTGVSEFDRMFNVYCSDPDTATRLLDFRTMNAIMEAESKLPGHIRFSLVNDRLYMAVDDGSPLLSKAGAEKADPGDNIDELIDKAMFEISALVGIIDALGWSAV